MIDPNDPIVELVDADDGTFTVKQASGSEIGPFPADKRERLSRIAALNTSAVAPEPASADQVNRFEQSLQPAPVEEITSAPVAESVVVAPQAAPVAAPAPAAPSTAFAPGLVTAGASDTIQSGTTATGVDERTRSDVLSASGEQDTAAIEAQQAQTATQSAIDADADAKIQTAIINTQQELADKKDQQAAGQIAYDNEMEKYNDAVNRKLDSSQVFEGKNLALAFAVGIAQAFANAFRAKAGQSANVDLIGPMIRRNLDEQRRKRQLQLGDSDKARAQIAKEMKTRLNDMSELGARVLDLQAKTSSDPIRRARAEEGAAMVRLDNKERAKKDALALGTKISKSVKETQALQSAAPKPTGGGRDFGQSAFPDAAAGSDIRDRELQIWAKKNGVKFEKALARYDKAINEYRPLAIQVAHADALDNVLKAATEGGTNDVAGYGRLAQFNPTEWTSDEGKRLRQSLGAEMAIYMNKISGAAVSEEERKRMNGIIIGSGSFKEMQNGLRMLAEESRAKAKTYRNGPDGLFAQTYDAVRSNSSRREAQAGGFAAQAAALKKSNAPTTEAEKAVSASDKLRARTEDARVKAAAKKNKPRRMAEATLKALGTPKAGESAKVKRMRKAAEANIEKARIRELQDQFADDVGGA